MCCDERRPYQARHRDRLQAKHHRPAGEAAYMPEKTRVHRVTLHPLVILWIFLLPSPIVIWLHQELAFAGAEVTWQFASLDRGEYLYAWTRNRLLAWAVLYALGAALLRVALPREQEQPRLSAFARTGPGRSLVPFVVLVLLIGMTFLQAPADTLLLGMAIAVAFMATWALASSGPQLAGIVAGALLAATTTLLIFFAAEMVMRRPSVVRATGGSLALRSLLFGEIHAPRADAQQRSQRRNALPKPPGTKRVVALGDSFTFGDWVARQEDAWPDVLEQRANERGHSVQVANVGVSGSDTVQEAEFLRGQWAGFDPDVVVLQYTLNDTGQAPDGDPLPLLPILGVSLKRTSALYAFLDSRFAALQWNRNVTGYNPFFEEHSPGWKASREAIRDIAAQARERGVPVLFVLFPMFDSHLDEQRYRHLAAHRAITDFVRELGLPFLDLREDFAALDPNPTRWWAMPFDSHPNPKAHRIAGQRVADYLISLGWL
jgi:lysophospholipase L1-like esterase